MIDIENIKEFFKGVFNFMANFDFSSFIPSTVKEWVLVAIVVILVLTLLLFNKGLNKLREIVNSYVQELREYNKFLEFNNLEDDFNEFKKRLALSSVFKGESDV